MLCVVCIFYRKENRERVCVGRANRTSLKTQKRLNYARDERVGEAPVPRRRRRPLNRQHMLLYGCPRLPDVRPRPGTRLRVRRVWCVPGVLHLVDV